MMIKVIVQGKKFALLLVILGLAFANYSYVTAQEDKPIKILPSDDAHVLADLSDPSDSLGLKQTNTGNLQVIELISSWNVTENNNAFVTIGYLKFDISKQNTYNLEKAELKMLTRDVTLSETPKKVVLLHAQNNNWKESDITYLKRPTFSTTVTSSAEIATPNTWYSWDVTNLVMQNPAAELSFALTFEVGRDNTQDYASFYSKETTDSNLAPFLELTFTAEPEIAIADDFELGSISLYAGIAIAIGGVIAGYSISKRKSQASKVVEPKPPTRINCSSCGSFIPSHFKFCPICGSKINQA